MDVPELHRKSVHEFGRRLREVGDKWNAPTPCTEWDVRTLVNHIVAENLWTPPIMAGKTVEDIGDQFDGDVLGDNPVSAFDLASAEAVAAIQREGAMDGIVHLSFGDFPGQEYALQLFADHLIHGWDLARAIGADERLDPELVDACTQWFAEREDAYRSGGAIAERPPMEPEITDPQARLLAMFGRIA
jgi:uncharacterized protein (TIGR03086 family)